MVQVGIPKSYKVLHNGNRVLNHSRNPACDIHFFLFEIVYWIGVKRASACLIHG